MPWCCTQRVARPGRQPLAGQRRQAAPNWKVLAFGFGHWTQKPAQTFADGIGFTFGTTPDPRLFVTDRPASGLLGDLTGKTLTATVMITGTATAFTAGEGPPENACGTPASVRLYFERNFRRAPP